MGIPRSFPSNPWLLWRRRGALSSVQVKHRIPDVGVCLQGMPGVLLGSALILIKARKCANGSSLQLQVLAVPLS